VKNILMDTGLGKGVTEYGNMGDVSMLQAAVDRLHQLFPEARIQVLTDSAESLARFCPEATPLDNAGRSILFGSGVLLGKYTASAPRWLVDLLLRFRRTIGSRFPELLRATAVWSLKFRNRLKKAEAVTAFAHALQNADLLLICGSGGFYDGCQSWNLETLDFVDAGIRRNVPVAMLGQGFGPLRDPVVLERASRVLPRVNFITLRGNRGSLELLQSLGVSESRLKTTGDEALELAYDSRTDKVGKGLGINLRFSGSASTDDRDIEAIRPVLHDFARQQCAPLIPLPIAMHPYSRDDLTIKQLLVGFDEQSDGGNTLDSPLKVMKQAALCRVVVTGAYHAAVFALAQGIPVVGLAKSPYFASKFLGLEDQFGEGCQTILLDEPAAPQRLRNAIERAWQNADRLRESLEAAARRQIELTKESYFQLRALAGSRTKTISGHTDT
jgi:polysaccharide pyruvyl transferase WcaK-like protein